MSIRAMMWALEQTAGSPMRKLVLLKLADNANDEGQAWPTQETIARQCEMSRRSVIRAIDQLEKDGFISSAIRSKEGFRESHVYTLSLAAPCDRESHGTNEPPCDRESHGNRPPCDRESHGHVTESHIEPVIEPKRLKEKDIGGQESLPLKTGNNSSSSRDSSVHASSSRKNKSSSHGTFCVNDCPSDIDEEIWRDLIQHRRTKRAPLTQTAWKRMRKQLDILADHGIDANEAIGEMLERGWQGLKAEYLIKDFNNNPTGPAKKGYVDNSANGRILA